MKKFMLSAILLASLTLISCDESSVSSELPELTSKDRDKFLGTWYGDMGNNHNEQIINIRAEDSLSITTIIDANTEYADTVITKLDSQDMLSVSTTPFKKGIIGTLELYYNSNDLSYPFINMSIRDENGNRLGANFRNEKTSGF